MTKITIWTPPFELKVSELYDLRSGLRHFIWFLDFPKIQQSLVYYIVNPVYESKIPVILYICLKEILLTLHLRWWEL